MSRLSLIAVAAVLAGPAGAQNVALVIGNENYRHGPDIGGAADALDAASALEGVGLVVEKGADLSTEAMRSLLRGYYAQTQRPGRSVILL